MITFGRISKPGSRPVNEDFIGAVRFKDKYLFILCDGLGGHGCGDVASRLATEAFAECFRGFEGGFEAFFEAAFSAAQKSIHETQLSNNSMALMKTTLVALVIDGDQCAWAHIGDSRLYYFKNDELVNRTADHSVPQMLYRSGDISEDEIRFHPDRNKLLRALGEEDETPRYTVSEIVAAGENASFLLCSDGFWEYITEDLMEQLQKDSVDANDWIRKMSAIVEQNNADKKADNYSAIAVMVRGNELN